jgi:hypothetical protein
MYAIGRAEIGAMLHHWPAAYFNWWWAKSREEYWSAWLDRYWQERCRHLVAVCLWRYSTDSQMVYENRAVTEIMEQTGGRLLPSEVTLKWVPYAANNWIRDSNGCRMMRVGGAFQSNLIEQDTLDNALKCLPEVWELTDKWIPPMLDSDHSDWITAYDLCHFAAAEVDFPHEKTEDVCKAVITNSSEIIERDMRAGVTELSVEVAPANRIGTAFANYHLQLAKIKNGIDPKNIANPTRFINMKKTQR